MEALFYCSLTEFIAGLEKVKPEFEEVNYSWLDMETGEIYVCTWDSEQAMLGATLLFKYMSSLSSEKKNLYCFLKNLISLIKKERHPLLDEWYTCLHDDAAQTTLYIAEWLVYYYRVYEPKRYTDLFAIRCSQLISQLRMAIVEAENEKHIEKTDSYVKAKEFTLDCIKHLKEKVIGQDEAIETLVTVLCKFFYMDVNQTTLILGGSGTGKNWILDCLQEYLKDVPILHVDVSRLSAASFKGVTFEEVMAEYQTMNPLQKRGIMILNEFDKLFAPNESSDGDVNRTNLNQLLTILENKYYGTEKILFILVGAFQWLTVEPKKEKSQVGFLREEGEVHEVEFDYDPEHIREILQRECHNTELIGRIQTVVRLSPLDKDAIKRVLLQEIEKMKSQLKGFISLTVTAEAVEEMFSQISETTNFGARHMKNVVTEMIDPWIIECFKHNLDEITITKPMVRKKMVKRLENVR